MSTTRTDMVFTTIIVHHKAIQKSENNTYKGSLSVCKLYTVVVKHLSSVQALRQIPDQR